MNPSTFGAEFCARECIAAITRINANPDRIIFAVLRPRELGMAFQFFGCKGRNYRAVITSAPDA